MFKIHGTYPFSNWRECGWHRICELDEGGAHNLIQDAIDECGALDEHDRQDENGQTLIINKGFRVVYELFGLVFAVYFHDYEYRLIACNSAKFRQVKMSRNSLRPGPEYPTYGNHQTRSS